MTEKYRKIIDKPRHVSKKRSQMPMDERSAQFAPFAALTGYDEVVKDCARTTERKIELDEYEIENINRKLCQMESENFTRLYEITYFVEDKKKIGGRYVTLKERVSGIDRLDKKLLTESGIAVYMNDIMSIEGISDEP